MSRTYDSKRKCSSQYVESFLAQFDMTSKNMLNISLLSLLETPYSCVIKREDQKGHYFETDSVTGVNYLRAFSFLQFSILERFLRFSTVVLYFAFAKSAVT